MVRPTQMNGLEICRIIGLYFRGSAAEWFLVLSLRCMAQTGGDPRLRGDLCSPMHHWLRGISQKSIYSKAIFAVSS